MWVVIKVLFLYRFSGSSVCSSFFYRNGYGGINRQDAKDATNAKKKKRGARGVLCVLAVIGARVE
jgi:hypothetical protein